MSAEGQKRTRRTSSNPIPLDETEPLAASSHTDMRRLGLRDRHHGLHWHDFGRPIRL